MSFVKWVAIPFALIVTIACFGIIAIAKSFCGSGYTGYETRWQNNLVGCQIRTDNGWVPVDNFIVNEQKD